MARAPAMPRGAGKTRSKPAIPVRVDSKGRLLIPQQVRKELGIQPGDTFFVQHTGAVLRYAKAENPFDGLAESAETEFHEGKTRDLRTFASEHCIDVDAE